MANLYKKRVVSRDPRTGQKVQTRSKKWWGQYKDAEGILRRHPLAVDKQAAQSMLNAIVCRVEREKAGLVDPTADQQVRPLKEHVDDFERYLEDKGITEKQAGEVVAKLRKIVAQCKWKRLSDINVGSLFAYLGALRRRGRSAQTHNNYLRAAKQFTGWLERERRNHTDPLKHARGVNPAMDRRHDRRPLSDEEFRLLVATAEAAGTIESISGEDRAMLYKLAAWTGFRRTELGSLTPSSLDLDGDPPTATVAACYAKGRRADCQILHPELAQQLSTWLEKRDVGPTQLLFPISGVVAGGTDRKTSKMIRLDLAAARAAWIKAAKSPEEKAQREKSDFLAYCNHQGRFADFHACRHRFITNLERSGVSPKMAQALARHKDIRLTLGIYTHVETEEKTKAIGALPAPPSDRCDVDA